MDFQFSKDEELLQFAAKDFADRELASKEPVVIAQSLRSVLRKMGELGFFSIKLPEEYGGDPGSWVMLGILVEEIAKVNVGLAYYILVSHQVGFSLATYGLEDTKKEWLEDIIKGEKIVCICSTETNAGTDFESISARAEKAGDQYLLNGVKTPISFGMEADLSLFFGKTERRGDTGLTAMLVPLNLSGISRSPVKHMGLHLSCPASLEFSQTVIPLKYRIGDEGEGFKVNATSGLLSNANKILSGLISLGQAQTALSLSIRYSKQRVAFGRPIAKFEGISGKLAEDATMIEAGRWLCYRALYLKDQKLAHVKEAAMSGWWCPKIAYQVIHHAIHVHGHSGYCDDHPFGQMFQDVIAFEMISGTEQILKLVIGNEMIGRLSVPDSISRHVDYLQGGGKND